MLTDFIESGQAYASSLDATAGKAVQLVLVAMQKLASSSVAAIRRALRGRLARIAEGRGDWTNSRPDVIRRLRQVSTNAKNSKGKATSMLSAIWRRKSRRFQASFD